MDFPPQPQWNKTNTLSETADCLRNAKDWAVLFINALQKDI